MSSTIRVAPGELTTRQAGLILGRSPSVVTQQIARGLLPARRTPRGWIVRVEDVLLLQRRRGEWRPGGAA